MRDIDLHGIVAATRLPIMACNNPAPAASRCRRSRWSAWSARSTTP